MNKTSNSENGEGGQGRTIRLVIIVAVVIFGLSGWVWWSKVRNNPQRTLHAAIENNLRTRSLVRQVEQKNGNQELEQNVALVLSTQPLAHGKTTISQSDSVDARVETEAISTGSEEYVRYTAIDTNQKNSKGGKIDFSDLLNIWGKTSSAQTGQPGELYGESVLGVIPTANLGVHDRSELMNLIRDQNVYEFDEKSLQRKTENGRPVYVYEVVVKPKAYITMLKRFGKIVDIKQLEDLDAEQYANAEPLQFKVYVDVWSQHITGVDFADGARKERMSGFGAHHYVNLPKESIPIEELQAKLQQIQ